VLEPGSETNRLTREIVDAAYAVHAALGSGLLESAYEQCLVHELGVRRLSVERQIALPILYKSARIDGAYRMDLLVEKQIVVEVKVVEGLLSVHQAQILTYLRLSGRCLGLLLNLNVVRMRDGVRRFVRTGDGGRRL
jgi:GxxExxY protein